MPGSTPDTTWITAAGADPLPAKERARLGDLTIAFLTAGTGPGPLLLWLPGFPANAYVWRRCIAGAAAAGFRSLALDPPGLGESEAPQAASYAPEAAAAVALALLEIRGEKDVRVVGEGTAAAIAVEMAARDPERVRAVAVCAPLGRQSAALRAAGALARAGAGELVLGALRIRRAADRLGVAGVAGRNGDGALERDLALRPLLATPESRARTLAFLCTQRPAPLPGVPVPLLVCGIGTGGAPPGARHVRLRGPAARLAARDPASLLDALLPFLAGCGR